MRKINLDYDCSLFQLSKTVLADTHLNCAEISFGTFGILAEEWLDMSFGCFGGLLGLKWLTNKGLYEFVVEFAY